MQIRKIYAVYFSPVGSTGKVTEAVAGVIAGKLGIPAETIDFTLPENRGGGWTFDRDELVVFGTPTYAGRVPNKALPFVQNLFHGDQTPAIPVVTFGNRNFDSSMTELKDELEKNRFCPFAAGAFAARHVFSQTIAAGRPDAKDMEILHAFAEKAAAKLLAAQDADALTRPVIRGGEPVAPYYVPKGLDGQPAKFLKAKPKTDPDLCDGCGTCAEACPMGSISRENTAEVTGICIKCQACVRLCPKGAKYFDDPAFLSHVAMLEKNFQRRAEPETFL